MRRVETGASIRPVGAQCSDLLLVACIDTEAVARNERIVEPVHLRPVMIDQVIDNPMHQRRRAFGAGLFDGFPADGPLLGDGLAAFGLPMSSRA